MRAPFAACCGCGIVTLVDHPWQKQSERIHLALGNRILIATTAAVIRASAPLMVWLEHDVRFTERLTQFDAGARVRPFCADAGGKLSCRGDYPGSESGSQWTRVLVSYEIPPTPFSQESTMAKPTHKVKKANHGKRPSNNLKRKQKRKKLRLP